MSDRARERVLEVVAEQGYEPNPNAKNLKLTTRTSIAVVVKGAHNLLFGEILEHIQNALSAAEESTQIIYIDEDANEVQEALRMNRSARFKGIIFLGGVPAHFIEGFSRINVPSVLLTNSAEKLGFNNLSSFTTDDHAAAADVIEELYAAGQTCSIGIIGGNREPEQIGTLRLEGAMEALEAHGVEFDVNRDYEPSRFSMKDGYDAMVHLMWRKPDMTAVFALGDAIAIGAARAALDMGKTVPGSISIAGFRRPGHRPVLRSSPYHHPPERAAARQARRLRAARHDREAWSAPCSPNRAVPALPQGERPRDQDGLVHEGWPCRTQRVLPDFFVSTFERGCPRMRSSGVLMPITSLPSPYGVGTMGAAAREFVDFLSAGAQTYWQVLPSGPTSFGDSPYQSFSTFAGNPYLIDFDDLAEKGLLKSEEYQSIEWGSDPCS